MNVLNETDVKEVSTKKLTEREGELFHSFLDIPDFINQLHSLADGNRNALISCGNDIDGVSLAKLLVRYVREVNERMTDKKVLYGECDSLNKLSLSTFTDDYDILVINHISGLREKLKTELFSLLSSEENEKLVLFIDSPEQIKTLYSSHPCVTSLFTSHFEMKTYSDDELLEIGKDYAISKGFCLDDMASLALCARIFEKSTYYHDTTPSDVRTFVDHAILNYKERKQKRISIFISKFIPRQQRSLLEKDFCFV